MHVLPCLSVFALPAYLCGPETGGPGSSPPRQTHGGVPTGGVSLQGDGERTGPTWAMEAYSPDPGSQVRRPPREPWLLFLQKPKGMRLGPCWAPARHASRLVAAGGGLASSPRGDWVLVPDPARAVGTSSLKPLPAAGHDSTGCPDDETAAGSLSEICPRRTAGRKTPCEQADDRPDQGDGPSCDHPHNETY